MYVAFSRPSDGGTHLVTVNQNIPGRAEGVEANDRYQPLFFNITVRDVTVTLAGQPVENDGTVRLVRAQRARLRVTPDDDRDHVVALTRPDEGALLRVDEAGRVVALDGGGSEPAQVDRIHEPEALRTHLQRRLAIPVREFTIEVVEDPPLFATLPDDATDLFAGLAANPRPGGTVFVIVPASIVSALAVDDASLGGLTTPAITVVTPPAGLADFVGDGAIYEVTFAAGDTPAAAVAIVFRASAQGVDGNIDFEIAITVDPA
jgi:hypothetical protein